MPRADLICIKPKRPCRKAAGAEKSTAAALSAMVDGGSYSHVDRAKSMRYLISPNSCSSLHSFAMSIGFIR
jgi:hypothetical protein